MGRCGLDCGRPVGDVAVNSQHEPRFVVERRPRSRGDADQFSGRLIGGARVAAIARPGLEGIECVADKLLRRESPV